MSNKIQSRFHFLLERNEELILAMAEHINQQRKEGKEGKSLICRELVPVEWQNEFVTNVYELMKGVNVDFGLKVRNMKFDDAIHYLNFRSGTLPGMNVGSGLNHGPEKNVGPIPDPTR